MGDSLAVTDHTSVYTDNSDANHCSSLLSSDDLLVVKKMDDSGGLNEYRETVEPLSSRASCSPSIGNNHEESRSVVVENGTVDEDSCGVNDCDASHLVSKIDDSKEMNDVDTEYEAEPVTLHVGRLCDDDHEVDLNLTVENDVDNSLVKTISRCCHEPDLPHSVTEKHCETVLSDGDCECDQVSEACDPNCNAATSTDCSDMVNSAADGRDVDTELKVQEDSSSPQKHPTSCVTSDKETVEFEADGLPTPGKSREDRDTGELSLVGDAELHLECEDDGADTSNTDSGLTACADAADEDAKTPPLVSTSTTDLVTSSTTSVSTVAIVVLSTSSSLSTSSLSNPNMSGLPTSVPVLYRMLSSTSSAAVTRPAPQNDKQPITVSVPSLAARASPTTRLMSKVLQDVGLLLVSQKVFKNLASVQKQKVGDSQSRSDTVLLQKLKASHQNLVAKNHGLLTALRKCWCGYRSESKNVIEAHRLRCDFQGRCCYCHGEFVYRTQNQMKKHLWKVHRKIGHVVERYGSNACAYCPLYFSSRWSLLQHMTSCRRNFWLSANLAPKESDKDIPVFASKLPVVVTPAARPQVAQNSSRSTLVSSATLPSSSIAPPVALQVTTAPRNPAPQLIQIGKQLYTFLPPTSSAISLPQSSVKSVSQTSLKSTAAQTAPSASSSVSIVVNNKSRNLAVRMPASALHQFTVCPVCSAFVKDKTSLLIHMQVAHSSTHKMCQYCCTPEVTFPSLRELNLHIAKCHVSDCWICKGRFQPPDLLISHIADRHRVTMRRMLELCRCYFCSSVPGLSSYFEFEEHMMKLHSAQFADIGKLWDRILFSQNADGNWYAKRNADGTLECPHCRGQFISASFLYRHLHLEHNGVIVRLVNCRECGKCMPSNILDVHLLAAHTRKCSVRLSYLEMPDHGCLFVPPVGTKRLKNRRASSQVLNGPALNRPPLNGPPLKRVRTVETVIISDDDSSDEREYIDNSSDEDFVVTTPIVIEPRRQRTQRTVNTRLDRRNSSVDDVHEVLASIVDSSESGAVSERPVGFRSTPISSATEAAAAQLCNGITEDEVEIIESIVPTLRDRCQHQPAGQSEHVDPVSGHCTANGTTADEISSDSGPMCAASDKTNVELAANEDSPTKPRSAVSELMARDQIMMDSVKEVLEIDGDTVLVVHGDEDDNDDDDDDE